MKKLTAWLLALTMCLTLSLSAFAAEVAPEPTPDTAQMEEADEWLFDEDVDGDVNWDEEEVEDQFFSDLDGDTTTPMLDEVDAVEETLMGAMEVYSWFMLQPLDVDTSKPDSSGTRYQVLDERFNTMQSLRDFVSSYFSDAIVEQLFSMNLYVEENGLLYTTEEGRNIDENIGETEFSVTEQTPEREVYSVTVHYWGEDQLDEAGEEEVFTYVRQLIDGQWRFVEFPFYW
ncbi:MAG: hypothetical protein RSA12_05525 [Clostridia bacterium]